MRRSMLVAVCLAVFVAALFAVDEQPLNVKPGLWQVEFNVKYSGLPPQYQQMFDQMSAQQKAAMGVAAPKTYKLCIKEKDLNKGWTQGDDNCRWKVTKSTSSDLELHSASCRGGDAQVDLKFHAVDSEHVRATMHGTQSENGMNATLDGNYTGKWLGSTCPDNLK